MSDNYENRILQQQALILLDKMIPSNREGLERLEGNSDEFVYKVASEIYNQSGHKASFSLIKSVVDERIKQLRDLCKIQDASLAKPKKNLHKNDEEILESIKKVLSEDFGVNEVDVKFHSQIILHCDLSYLETSIAIEFDIDLDYRDNFSGINSMGNFVPSVHASGRRSIWDSSGMDISGTEDVCIIIDDLIQSISTRL